MILSPIDQEPCLYLPCFSIFGNTIDNYLLLVRLLQNKIFERTASCTSLSGLTMQKPISQNRSAYHNINNQIDYNGFSNEVGFNIDDQEVHSESECSDEETTLPWMVDIIGIQFTRMLSAKGSVDNIQMVSSVHKTIACSASTFYDNREKIIDSIDRSIPRLRSVSLKNTIALLQSHRRLTFYQEINNNTFQVYLTFTVLQIGGE